jgi:acyl carrier protein
MAEETRPSDGNRERVRSEVVEIISNRLGVGKEQITDQTTFQEDLGADSLDVVELVMELEEKFKIQIPDEEAEKIKTVGAAVDYVVTHQKYRAPRLRIALAP